MIGVSLLFAFLWNMLRFLIRSDGEALIHQAKGPAMQTAIQPTAGPHAAATSGDAGDRGPRDCRVPLRCAWSQPSR